MRPPLPNPLLIGAMLASCLQAFALNPALDASQYAHHSWRYRDGFVKGDIYDMAQTPDGYLWLGTGFGMFRFDGVRAVPWQPPGDQHLPSSMILRLLAARDGTLWIGTRNGLASWKNGKLTQYPDLGGLYVFSVMEDRSGTVWAGASGLPDGKLCEVRGMNVQCRTDPNLTGHGVMALDEDQAGNVWVGFREGVWRLKPGPSEFYSVPGEFNGILGIANGPDGAPLIGVTGAVKRLAGGKAAIAYRFPEGMRKTQTQRLLRDRDGGIWVGTVDRGIIHIHQDQIQQQKIDTFAQTDGLTSDNIYRFFEDREGNIWTATSEGLDRFHDLPVVTWGLKQGLSAQPTGAVLAAKDGSVWFGTRNGLDRIQNGEVVAYRRRGSVRIAGVRQIDIDGFSENGSRSLFEDRSGRIWVSTGMGTGYIENGRFVPRAPGGNVDSILEDSAGNMWVGDQEQGLLRSSPKQEVAVFPWTAFGHTDAADPVALDPTQDGLWLGFFRSGIVWFRDGKAQASFAAADGLATGRVMDLRFDKEGALWIAAEGGLSRMKNGHIATLTSRDGLPCDAVHWTIEDDAGALWLYMPCGLVRVEREDVNAWIATPPGQVRKVRPTIFDSSDGATLVPTLGGYTPRVARSADGKLWFVTAEGISAIDPNHLQINKVAPPVEIEQITADRKTSDVTAARNFRLPALVRDLEIDYTALSLVEPEKMRFRYKLEGRDRDWQDAGNRRQAFYNDLSPRNYRFRVVASNNSGVWNEAGASFDFAVAPAPYQTIWFRLGAIAVLLGLLGALYQLRARRVRRQFKIRMDERASVARDLHDTLLQSFQGLLLKFCSVAYLLPDRPLEAKMTLEGAIDQARQALTEGRSALEGLRSCVETDDLAGALITLGQGLASDVDGQTRPDLRMQVEGVARDLTPLVRDEAYRIGVEALRNAFRHAKAARIEIELRYDRRQLRLRIRDSGKGIDPKMLIEGGYGGHHGVRGMYERAAVVRGKLAVWSELGSGTEVELRIPGSVAYGARAAWPTKARIG